MKLYDYESPAEAMKAMVQDWFADNDETAEGLEIDGDPYYDEDIGRWVQNVIDDKHNLYYLVDYNGMLYLCM